MPQAMKIPVAKAAVDKEWEKLEKVRSKEEVIDEARTSGAKVHFASLMDMSFEKCWIRGKAPKVQRWSCTPRWYCERRFWILRSIHWTRIISITTDSSKSHGRNLHTAWLRRTSSWRSICSYPKLLKIPKSECPDIRIRLPRHKWPKSWCRTIVWTEIWENPIATRLGKSFFLTGSVYLSTEQEDYSNQCLWMTSNWLERNTILIRCGKYSTKKSIWENQHLSLIMYTWDAPKDNVK